MLVLFFGVSCVGKTTLIGELTNRFGWKYVPTPITRPLRENETGKVPVSREQFLKMKERGEFICVNEWFGNLYGTPFKEIEIAVNDNDNRWVLDFPLSKRHLFEIFPHVGVVIMPETVEQLIRQIKKARREDRLGQILDDYKNNHNNLSELEMAKTFIVINHEGKDAEVAERINYLVKFNA